MIDGDAFGVIIQTKSNTYEINLSLEEVDEFEYEFDTSFFIPEIIESIGFGKFNVIFSLAHELYHYTAYKTYRNNTEYIADKEAYLFLIKYKNEFR